MGITSIKDDLDRLKHKYEISSQLLSCEELYEAPDFARVIEMDIIRLKPLVELYDKYLDLEKFISDLSETLQTAEGEDKELFTKGYKTSKVQIEKCEKDLIKLLNEIKGDEQSITLEIVPHEEDDICCKIVTDLASAYIKVCESRGYIYVLDEARGLKFLTIDGFNCKDTFMPEVADHRGIKDGVVGFCRVMLTTNVPKKKIIINEKDLKIEYTRSSGAGGQHVNTTDSAVRITHLPTGVVAFAQDERSQFRNREIAMSRLIEKLNAYYSLESLHESEKERKEQAKRFKKGHYIRTFDYDRDMVIYKSKEKSLKEFLQGKIND